MGYTISIDTGGTFTDGYVTGPDTSVRAKVDTTPHDVTVGILDCIEAAAGSLGMTRPELLRRTDFVQFSTTIATNTLITRRGPKVGLLIGSSLHEALLQRWPEHLPLSQELVQAVPEPFAEGLGDAVSAAVHEELERGARVVVVALSGGPDLAARESSVREIIAADYPRHYLGAVPVLPSHQVSLAPDPWVRIQTAVLDAYLHPELSRSLHRLEDQLRAEGYRRPLLIANSDAATSRLAKTTALRTWGSGPACGIAGASEVAASLGLEHVITLDIGGTSSDISFLRDGKWTYQVQPRLEGIEVSLPAVEIESIGVGGGSIVRLIEGRCEVGPDSAGAQPGPAAFGLGGTEATLTDAACSLGLFDPAHFLGGRKTLDIEAAENVIRESIATPMGLAAEEAAYRVLDRAADKVAETIRARLNDRGLEAATCAIFATGGAGGLLASEVGRKAGVTGVYAFPLNPVFGAFGLSRLDVSHSYDAFPAENMRATVQSLRERALVDLRGEELGESGISFRLEGETESGDSVSVIDLGDADDVEDCLLRIAECADVLRLVRLRATAPRLKSEVPKARASTLSRVGERQVFWQGASHPTPVYDWSSAPMGETIGGPALLETEQTTLLVPPGSSATVGAYGEICFQMA